MKLWKAQRDWIALAVLAAVWLVGSALIVAWYA